VNEREREEAADLFQDEMDRRAEEHVLLHEARKTIRSTNIQPDLVARLLAASEPCLFRNQSQPVVTPYQISSRLLVSYALCCDFAKQHAREQVEFFEQLNRETENERV